MPDESFDLIVGHSVFTHLSEKDQFIWLSELKRIARPGATLVVTVMLDCSAALESFSWSDYCSLRTNGFFDSGWQDDGVDVLSPGYYRRVFHTVDYILSCWGAYFEIIAILDGYSDHQAAIVLRKRDA